MKGLALFSEYCGSGAGPTSYWAKNFKKDNKKFSRNVNKVKKAIVLLWQTLWCWSLLWWILRLWRLWIGLWDCSIAVSGTAINVAWLLLWTRWLTAWLSIIYRLRLRADSYRCWWTNWWWWAYLTDWANWWWAWSWSWALKFAIW